MINERAAIVMFTLLASAAAAQTLPPGHVQGDVVSYSYVPIRTWRPVEGLGVLPYLFEYNLQACDSRQPLESFHVENVRRIDLASQWSTAIMLYARHDAWRTELINLMLRCYRHRQLIVLANYYDRADKDDGPYGNTRRLLEELWTRRDEIVTNPEGDRASGLQLINNVLANKCGDEGEAALGTAGLGQVYEAFDREVRLRRVDGERPFRHIKAWYNMIGYCAWPGYRGYAASQEDVDRRQRFKLPANTQAIGVDVYHYWGINGSPFDPADLTIPRERVRAHTDEWHRLRTHYYPDGLSVSVCPEPAKPEFWEPRYWNDTHALLSALELASARNAMLWYIGVSGQLGPADTPADASFTTPVETMEAYFDELKAGPWVALAWWVFGDFSPTTHGGLDYYDRTLKHYTREHPAGKPYSPELLDYWHNEYVRVKRAMFRDVVYGQFGHLNGPEPQP